MSFKFLAEKLLHRFPSEGGLLSMPTFGGLRRMPYSKVCPRTVPQTAPPNSVLPYGPLLGRPHKTSTFLRPHPVPLNRNTSRRSICESTCQENSLVPRVVMHATGGLVGAAYGAHTSINIHKDCPPKAVLMYAISGAMWGGFVGTLFAPYVIVISPLLIGDYFWDKARYVEDRPCEVSAERKAERLSAYETKIV